MSSVHDGVSCDGCMAPNFSGDRYKCLRCYDFDLCARCYAEERASLAVAANTNNTSSSSSRNNSETLRDISRQNLRIRDSNDEHSPTHPMQCIMTQQDFELTYQGDQSHQWDKWRVVIFTCPVCGQQGFSRARLVAHVIDEHSQPSTQHEMACPICISTDFYRVGFGDYMPNQLTDMVSHMQEHHSQTTVTSNANNASGSSSSGLRGGGRAGMSTRGNLGRGLGNHRTFTIGGGRGISEFLRAGGGVSLRAGGAGLRGGDDFRRGQQAARGQVSLLTTSTPSSPPRSGTTSLVRATASPPNSASPSRLLLSQQRHHQRNHQQNTNANPSPNPNRNSSQNSNTSAAANTTQNYRRYNGAANRASNQRTGLIQQQNISALDSAFDLDFPLYLDSELDYLEGQMPTPPPISASNNTTANNNGNGNSNNSNTTASRARAREGNTIYNNTGNNNSNTINNSNDNHRSDVNSSNNAAAAPNDSATRNRGGSSSTSSLSANAIAIGNTTRIGNASSNSSHRAVTTVDNTPMVLSSRHEAATTSGIVRSTPLTAARTVPSNTASLSSLPMNNPNNSSDNNDDNDNNNNNNSNSQQQSSGTYRTAAAVGNPSGNSNDGEREQYEQQVSSVQPGNRAVFAATSNPHVTTVVGNPATTTALTSNSITHPANQRNQQFNSSSSTSTPPSTTQSTVVVSNPNSLSNSEMNRGVDEVEGRGRSDDEGDDTDSGEDALNKRHSETNAHQKRRGVIVVNSVGRAVLRLTPSLSLLSSSQTNNLGQNRTEAQAQGQSQNLTDNRKSEEGLIGSDRTSSQTEATIKIEDANKRNESANMSVKEEEERHQHSHHHHNQQNSKASHVQAIWPVLMAGRTSVQLPEVCLKQQRNVEQSTPSAIAVGSSASSSFDRTFAEVIKEGSKTEKSAMILGKDGELYTETTGDKDGTSGDSYTANKTTIVDNSNRTVTTTLTVTLSNSSSNNDNVGRKVSEDEGECEVEREQTLPETIAQQGVGEESENEEEGFDNWLLPPLRLVMRVGRPRHNAYTSCRDGRRAFSQVQHPALMQTQRHTSTRNCTSRDQASTASVVGGGTSLDLMGSLRREDEINGQISASQGYNLQRISSVGSTGVELERSGSGTHTGWTTRLSQLHPSENMVIVNNSSAQQRRRRTAQQSTFNNSSGAIETNLNPNSTSTNRTLDDWLSNRRRRTRVAATSGGVIAVGSGSDAGVAGGITNNDINNSNSNITDNNNIGTLSQSSSSFDTSPSFLLRYARRYQRSSLFQEAATEVQQANRSRIGVANRNQNIPTSQPTATTAQDQRGISTTNTIQMVPVSRAIEIIRRLDARNNHNLPHRLSPSDHSNSHSSSTAIDYLSLLRRSEAALHAAAGSGSTPRVGALTTSASPTNRSSSSSLLIGSANVSGNQGVTQSNRSATSLLRRQSGNIHQQDLQKRRVSKSKSGAGEGTGGQRDGVSRSEDLNEFFENAFKVPDLEVLLDGDLIERPRLFEPFHVRSQEDRERYFEPWLREEEQKDNEAAEEFLATRYQNDQCFDIDNGDGDDIGTDVARGSRGKQLLVNVKRKRSSTEDSQNDVDNNDNGDSDDSDEEELKLCDEEELLNQTTNRTTSCNNNNATDNDNNDKTVTSSPYDFQRSHHIVIGPVNGMLNGRDDTESNYWSDYRFLHNRRDRCVAYERSESTLDGCYDWRFARQLVLGAWDAPISLYLRSHYQPAMFSRVLKTNLRELMKLRCKNTNEGHQENEQRYNENVQQEMNQSIVIDGDGNNVDECHQTEVCRDAEEKTESEGEYSIEVHPNLWFMLDLAAFVEIV